jgi:hypothetical protein
MAYQRYNMSTTPPPIYTSDGYLSSYNPYLSYEQKYQIAGQGNQPQAVMTAPLAPQVTVPSAPVIQQPIMAPQQVMVPSPPQQVMMPAPQQQLMATVPPQLVASAPPIIIQTPTTVAPTVAHIEPNGWTFINIILVLLLISSCLMSIINLVNGDILNAVITIICLSLFYWIYSAYNHHDTDVHK